MKGALSLSRGKRGMSHPYQLRAFLFHNSRAEAEPPLSQTYTRSFMYGLSIPSLFYSTSIFSSDFFYRRARECAEHTQPYTWSRWLPQKGFSPSFTTIWTICRVFFSFSFHGVQGSCGCGSCSVCADAEIKQRVNEISERRLE